MLVLNRKVGETICINGQITVTVSRIQGRRVSLAIHAPKEMHVVRGELRPFDTLFPSNHSTEHTPGEPESAVSFNHLGLEARPPR